MNTFKSLTHALAVTLLPIMLFSFGALMSAYQVLGSPDPLKQALSESGIYDEVISQALKSAQKQATSNVSEDIPISDPGVQSVINQAIPADTIRTQAEKAIDGVYGWAQGKDNSLQFNFNLGSDTKTKIADGLAGYTTEHLSTLPTCEGSDTGGIENPLTATCLPAGFDKTAAAEKVRSDIVNNPEFLKDTTVDASTTKTDDGKTLADKFKALPNIYEQVKIGLYISGILAVACAVAVIFCAGTIRTGLKRVAIISIVVGAVSVVLAWGAGFALHQFAENPKLTLGDNADLQKPIVKAVEIFTSNVRNWWLVYGLVLTGAGVVTLVVLSLTRPPKNKIAEMTPTPIDRVQEQKPIAQRLAEQQTSPASQRTPAVPTAPPIPRPTGPASRPGYRPGKKIQ